MPAATAATSGETPSRTIATILRWSFGVRSVGRPIGYLRWRGRLTLQGDWHSGSSRAELLQVLDQKVEFEPVDVRRVVTPVGRDDCVRLIDVLLDKGRGHALLGAPGDAGEAIGVVIEQRHRVPAP